MSETMVARDPANASFHNGNSNAGGGTGSE
jgi:hypothetical protein